MSCLPLSRLRLLGYSARMGEEITLNEKNYRITLSHNKDSGAWKARWGTLIEVSAFSGPTALRLLADRLETERQFGAAAEQLQQYLKQADVLCKYCHAPIFFAVVNSGRFLAFDTEPIDGVDAAEGERVATFPRMTFSQRGPKPQTQWHFGGRQGPVYVPHPATCGDSVTEPQSQVLKARWKQNRTVSAERRDHVIEGLRRIKADIQQGALDDPRQSM